MPKSSKSLQQKWSKNCEAAKRIIDRLVQRELNPLDTSKKALLNLKQSDPIFQQYSDQRFVINVKNLFDDFTLNEKLKGKRAAVEGK